MRKGVECQAERTTRFEGRFWAGREINGTAVLYSLKGLKVLMSEIEFALSFEESLLIMESLVPLRPEIVQKLLEICRFVKVKRLFMYMAEKHRHPWVEKLDLSRIDFGRGKRRIVSGGALAPKYQTKVPRERREGPV